MGAMSALNRWLRNKNFAFVRFSHKDDVISAELIQVRGSIQANPFPFIPRYGGELIVPLKNNDSEMLADFQQIARQEIKKAATHECEIKRSNELADFESVWPIYANRAKQKSLRMGSLADYSSLFKLTPPQSSLVRVYTAYYGSNPVYSAVFLKECKMAHYFIGALDVEALGKKGYTVLPASLARNA